jgi:hypothetical protein
VIPLLQPGAVGPYLVWGTWFSTHLPLEGTWSYPDLGFNWRPTVLVVQDPDSSPRAFRRVGGWSHSLDGRQNRYPYVTMGATARLDGVAMRLKPP